MRAWALAAATLLAGCDRSGPPPAAPAPSASPPAPPVAASGPKLLAAADVDLRLLGAWRAAGVTPTAPADDATWVRRAWLDVVGTIPPPEVVRRFLADGAADKRSRALEDLLASPMWADHWTAYWDDVWMGRDARRPDVDRGAFRGFLHDAFARNAPWNALVTELLTATGQNSEGGSHREADADEGRDGGRGPTIRGAVNWTLKYQDAPQDLAGAASRTLLGVQIQCAQCHDHKTEKWTQHDFQAFAAAFVRTRVVPIDAGNAMGMVKRVEVRDLDRAAPRFAKMGDLEAVTKAVPTALDGTPLDAGVGVRAALAQWMTRPDNPWFARAFVNRMWGHFLGRGFVDPVDDLRPSNPPVEGDLLAALAADFVASGYDVKHLVRVIVGTAAYARSAAPLDDATTKADPEVKLWERFRVSPLGPSELLDALVAATDLEGLVRANGRLDLAQVRFRVRERYGFLFDVDEETDEKGFEGTVAQGLALLNGSVVATGASDLPGGALRDVLAMPGDDAAKLEALYVRVLSRLPTPDEISRWRQFLAAPPSGVSATVARDAGSPAARRAGSPQPLGKRLPPDPLRGVENRAAGERVDGVARAYEDVLWALLNSSEFGLNH
ncbi:MAG TPA: DUF1549 and DUF1553 domain-containing protein [Polyangiaceae bacterium]|nr:DUF1549 and DUF1553 domain-containing protein [Polyangiaceae bacterium]